MRNFQLIAQGVDMTAVRQQLLHHDYLWNQHPFRTQYTGTPHVDVDDILLRFSPEEDCNIDDPTKVMDSPSIVWYPARMALSAVRPLVLDLGRVVGAYAVDRIIITRLRKGGRILPHRDVAGAYVNQPDVQRYHLIVQGLEGSQFACGDADTANPPELVQMLTGEIWWFDAHREHERHNKSADDAIHILADYRIWG